MSESSTGDGALSMTAPSGDVGLQTQLNVQRKEQEHQSGNSVFSDITMMIVRERLKFGQCPTCGQQCYQRQDPSGWKVSAISLQGRVDNGRCLICAPDGALAAAIMASMEQTPPKQSPQPNSVAQQDGEPTESSSSSPSSSWPFDTNHHDVVNNGGGMSSDEGSSSWTNSAGNEDDCCSRTNQSCISEDSFMIDGSCVINPDHLLEDHFSVSRRGSVGAASHDSLEDHNYQEGTGVGNVIGIRRSGHTSSSAAVIVVGHGGAAATPAWTKPRRDSLEHSVASTNSSSSTYKRNHSSGALANNNNNININNNSGISKRRSSIGNNGSYSATPRRNSMGNGTAFTPFPRRNSVDNSMTYNTNQGGGGSGGDGGGNYPRRNSMDSSGGVTPYHGGGSFPRRNSMDNSGFAPQANGGCGGSSGGFVPRRRSMGTGPSQGARKRRNSIGDNGTYRAVTPPPPPSQQHYQQQQPMPRRDSLGHTPIVSSSQTTTATTIPVRRNAEQPSHIEAVVHNGVQQDEPKIEAHENGEKDRERDVPDKVIVSGQNTDDDHDKKDSVMVGEGEKKGKRDGKDETKEGASPPPILTFENPTHLLLEKLEQAAAAAAAESSNTNGAEGHDLVRYMEEVGDTARDPEIRKELGRSKMFKDGISIVLEIMADFKTNRDVQEMACRAISNLACGNLLNQETIASKNGIWLTLQALNRYDDDASIQHRACYALGNLALNNPNNQKLIVEKGALAFIANAMRRFPEDAQVQHRACFAFAKLGRGQRDTQLRIRYQEGIIDLVEAAKNNHPDNKRVQKLANTVLKMSTDAVRKPIRRSITK